MKRLRYGAWLLAVVALASVGCSDDTPTATTPTAPILTEPPFAGTLTVNGAVTQPFTATTFGQVTLTLKTLDPNPDNTARIGMALGTWSGTTCQIILANDNAPMGITVIGTVAAAGTLCARVYDVGKLLEPIAFEVTINHP